MDFDKEIEALIDRSIEEDIRTGDITSEACVLPDAQTKGVIILKQKGCIAGLRYLSLLFRKLNPQLRIEQHVNEGSLQKAGTPIASVIGPARALLSGERTALNLLQHASGVATVTNAYVQRVAGYDCAILDTRATLPGLRALEKYAVKIGGGTIHRWGLDDRFIIKRNCLSFLAHQYPQPILEAIQRVKHHRPFIPIEVEIYGLNELAQVLDTDVEAVMLKNMAPQEICSAVKQIHRAHKRAYTESHAAITLDTIREYAETGVDGISVAALTHSVPSLQMSLRLVPS